MIPHLVKLEVLFFIRRPTDWKGQQVWNRAVWFNVVLQPGFTQNWDHTCYLLFSSCSVLWLPSAEHWWKTHGVPCGSTFGAQQQKFEINTPLEGICLFSQLECCSQLQNVSTVFAAKGIRSWSSQPPAYNFFFFNEYILVLCVLKRRIHWNALISKV